MSEKTTTKLIVIFGATMVAIGLAIAFYGMLNISFHNMLIGD